MQRARSNKDFFDFSVERFLRGLNECHGVVLNSLESASGSSLTDDGCKICSRGAIGRLHSSASIFHLFNNIYQSTSSLQIHFLPLHLNKEYPGVKNNVL